jgi:hypothetical protein
MQIQTSIDKTKGAEIRHITAMAAELLKHAPNVNATYGLYFRLALIVSFLHVFRSSLMHPT